MDDDFAYLVFAIVAEIPKGKVVSYQQLAELAGRKKNARLVAKIIANSNCYGDFPCHRVVNYAGRTAACWKEQKQLLLDEGVCFKSNGCVDMKSCKWKI